MKFIWNYRPAPAPHPSTEGRYYRLLRASQRGDEGEAEGYTSALLNERGWAGTKSESNIWSCLAHCYVVTGNREKEIKAWRMVHATGQHTQGWWHKAVVEMIKEGIDIPEQGDVPESVAVELISVYPEVSSLEDMMVAWREAEVLVDGKDVLLVDLADRLLDETKRNDLMRDLLGQSLVMGAQIVGAQFSENSDGDGYTNFVGRVSGGYSKGSVTGVRGSRLKLWVEELDA